MNNEVQEGDGFFISYNPNVGDWGSFSSDDGASETALVNRKGSPRFLILNGDFRKHYKKLIPKGYDACRAFYESKKKEHRSSWSEDKD